MRSIMAERRFDARCEQACKLGGVAGLLEVQDRVHDGGLALADDDRARNFAKTASFVSGSAIVREILRKVSNVPLPSHARFAGLPVATARRRVGRLGASGRDQQNLFAGR
jgi:hypothetical protein